MVPPGRVLVLKTSTNWFGSSMIIVCLYVCLSIGVNSLVVVVVEVVVVLSLLLLLLSSRRREFSSRCRCGW